MDPSEMIKAEVLRMPEYQPRNFEPRMSSSGDCPRALRYDKEYQRPAPSFGQAMRMMLGDYTHLMMQQILTKTYTDFHSAEIEIEYVDDGVTIKGHPDGVIDSLDCVVEIKSSSQETMRMVLNSGPLPSHIRQGNVYGYVLKKKNVLFIYVNRNNGEIYCHPLPVNGILAEQSLDMLIEVAKAPVGEQIPRPYSNPSESPCWFCSHKERCYEGFDQEIAGMKTGVEYHHTHVPLLAHSAYESVQHRNARLILERAEEDKRAEVIIQMMSMQEKALSIVYENTKISIEMALSKGKEKKLNATIREIK
jgi:HSP20 family molecular chaperone IbpA